MSISQSRLALLALCFVQWVSGRVVQFQLDLTYEDVSVAGDVHKAIVSNGQVPGPTLWLKQGDDVEFLVNNSMSISTTVHFHGDAKVVCLFFRKPNRHSHPSLS